MRTMTLTVGQAVAWRPSPSGFAQICELRRTKVRICYRTKHGKTRFALVKAEAVCVEQLLFQMDNPFNRGRPLLALQPRQSRRQALDRNHRIGRTGAIWKESYKGVTYGQVSEKARNR